MDEISQQRGLELDSRQRKSISTIKLTLEQNSKDIRTVVGEWAGQQTAMLTKIHQIE
jgi:hypothetical protein